MGIGLPNNSYSQPLSFSLITSLSLESLSQLSATHLKLSLHPLCNLE